MNFYLYFIVLYYIQYYVKNLKTLWHTATYVYNSEFFTFLYPKVANI